MLYEVITQQQRLDALLPLIAARLEALQTVIDRRTALGTAAAAAVAAQPDRLTERIRASITRMRNTEQVRLQRQEA